MARAFSRWTSAPTFLEVHLAAEFEQAAGQHEDWPLPGRTVGIVLDEHRARVERIVEVEVGLDASPAELEDLGQPEVAQGPALFKIPVDGGAPVRLVAGQAVNPVWSRDGRLIVYSGPVLGGLVPLLGMRPDGAPVELPRVRARPGGYRFLPNGTGLVYLPRAQSLDFWLLDLATKTTRQLTRLSNQGVLRTFDITPDGKDIVFDRSRENSDIALIDLPK